MAQLPPGCRQNAPSHTARECCRGHVRDPTVLRLSAEATGGCGHDRDPRRRESRWIRQDSLHTRRFQQETEFVAALAELWAQTSAGLHSAEPDLIGSHSIALHSTETNLPMCSSATEKTPPPAPQSPTHSPTLRPQTTAGSSQSEVSRTVSANSVLGPRRFLTSTECAQRLLLERFTPGFPDPAIIHRQASHL